MDIKIIIESLYAVVIGTLLILAFLNEEFSDEHIERIQVPVRFITMILLAWAWYIFSFNLSWQNFRIVLLQTILLLGLLMLNYGFSFFKTQSETGYGEMMKIKCTCGHVAKKHTNPTVRIGNCTLCECIHFQS